MKYKHAVIITGPNAVGKTKVAYELARALGDGEIINMDRLYLFKNFPISSGFSDVLKEQGVQRHLYELLFPDEEIYDIKKYTEMVVSTSKDVLKRDGLPIIEGGSPKYFSGLYQYNKNDKSNFFAPLIGLKYAKSVNLKKKITKRIEQAFQEGLVDEIKSNLPKYRNTKIMSEAKAIVPVVRYLDKKIGIDEAKEEILRGCLELSDYQMTKLSQFEDIIWIEYESDDLRQTVEKIIKLIKDQSN